MARLPHTRDASPDDEIDDAGEDEHEAFGGLPALLVEIAEIAGLEAAITLADRYGGNRVYIPRRASDSHWLTLCVGRKAADLICHHFAHPSGIELELPRGPALNRTERQARLRRLIAQGLTSTEITQRLGTTRRSVTRNRSAMVRDLDGTQLDLFPEPSLQIEAPKGSRSSR